MSVEAFSPDGVTATISVSGTTNNAQLAGTGNVIRVYNAHDYVVFIKSGDSTVEATSADLPIVPGSVETFSIPQDHDYIAALAASGEGTLYVTRGEGG